MPENTFSYKDSSLPIEQRVIDLLERMTLQEKIGQLTQMFIMDFNQEEMLMRVRQGGLGSRILSSSNLAGSAEEQARQVEALNEVQRLAVEESRLGIPLIHGRDVIHGYRTVFPIPLGMAASFNPGLVEEAFAIAAREAASGGVHWSFAPMLDIAHDPRWGRIIEGFGEDPYLASQLAQAAVRGLQGDDLASPDHVLACAKHYIGYGAAEGGRDYNTAEISDTTLRNVYLAPFKAAVEAGVGSVMSGFHDLNGESVSGSHSLLTGLLKEELSFQGFVVSDWASVWELINHRVAAGEREAASLALESGVDMDMCTTVYLNHLEVLVQRGEISQERLDDACRRILTAKFRLGLFEQPYTDPGLGSRVQFSAAHQATARRLAQQSMVLLQNNKNLLPLPRENIRIAVIGPVIDERGLLLGSWSIDGVAGETQTFDEAMRRAAPQAIMPHVSDNLSDEMLAAALRADVVVLAVGESAQRSGENHSVASISLPAGQDELIEAVAGLGKPLVLVVFAGRPVNLSHAVGAADAILYAWHPGSLGAAAAADLLFGDANPSGRLPVSFPRSDGQIPIYYNFKSTGKTFDGVGNPIQPGEYNEVNRYLDLPGSPLFPFGFGLSYSTFEYDDLHLSAPTIKLGERVTIRARVTNPGVRAGVEVAQLYMQDCVASITLPARELKGFQRVTLRPGESQQIEFSLGRKELSFYGRDGKLHLEAGQFKIFIGPNCRAELGASFNLVE